MAKLYVLDQHSATRHEHLTCTLYRTAAKTLVEGPPDAHTSKLNVHAQTLCGIVTTDIFVVMTIISAIAICCYHHELATGCQCVAYK